MAATALRVPLYPIEVSTPPFTCAVTGASGYVAGALVQRLLAAGHIVHGTVRNPNDTVKLANLTSLPGASERLKLFPADLQDTSSFDAAVKGCKFVFHVASPFILGVSGAQDAQEKLIGPAVSGVEAVLGAVSRTGDTEAVIMTSSVVATVGDNWENGRDHVLSEADWNKSASATFLPYPYSKTLAERKAWELYRGQAREEEEKKKKWKLVTINPGFVLGPPLALSSAESIKFCSDMLAGKFKQVLPSVHSFVVDVDDVAAAHALAALTTASSGRYLCISEAIDFRKLVQDAEIHLGRQGQFLGGFSPPKWLLWVACNVFRVAAWDTLSAGINKPLAGDTSKIKSELGMTFIPAGKSLGEMAAKVEVLQAKANDA